MNTGAHTFEHVPSRPAIVVALPRLASDRCTARPATRFWNDRRSPNRFNRFAFTVQTSADPGVIYRAACARSRARRPIKFPREIYVTLHAYTRPKKSRNEKPSAEDRSNATENVQIVRHLDEHCIVTDIARKGRRNEKPGSFDRSRKKSPSCA